MCLIAVAYGVSRRYPFVLAANRDERHERATAALAQWPGGTGMIGGRDLVAGGTWLAADRRARVAAVTNLHGSGAAAGRRSRGTLVAGFTGADVEAEPYVESILERRSEYGPFNLLLYDGENLRYLNRHGDHALLPCGVHALSNALLGDDWPKTLRAAGAMQRALDATDAAGLEAALFDFLEERDRAGPTRDLRDSVFIRGSEFGTRSASVVVLSAAGEMTFAERRFDAGGELAGQHRLARKVRAVQESDAVNTERPPGPTDARPR